MSCRANSAPRRPTDKSRGPIRWSLKPTRLAILHYGSRVMPAATRHMRHVRASRDQILMIIYAVKVGWPASMIKLGTALERAHRRRYSREIDASGNCDRRRRMKCSVTRRRRLHLVQRGPGAADLIRCQDARVEAHMGGGWGGQVVRSASVGDRRAARVAG